jgi:hypothetical protein
MPPPGAIHVPGILFSVATVTAAFAGNRGVKIPAIPIVQAIVAITTKMLNGLFLAIIVIL